MNGYPAGPNNTYIPSMETPTERPTLEHIRSTGVIVGTNPTRTQAMVTYNIGLMVCFTTVFLNPDGTIGDLVPDRRAINKFVRVQK